MKLIAFYGRQSHIEITFFRCVVGFLFTFAGIFGKTVMTIGMHDTMHQFMDKERGEYWNMVSNDAFLKDSLIRGILSSMFLELGWLIVGLIAKSAIFSLASSSPSILGFKLFGDDVRRRRRDACGS